MTFQVPGAIPLTEETLRLEDIFEIINVGSRTARVTVGTLQNFLTQASGFISALKYIPQSLWSSIRDGTNTVDLLAYLQEASDEATAKNYALVFPPGQYRTFGELHTQDISVYFFDATIVATRDDLAAHVAQGDDIIIWCPRAVGVYATPAQGANPAGSRIQRSSAAPYNISPYTQGGLARSPWRDRNAGLFLINADRAIVVDAYAENFNIGLNCYGSYTASNSDPGVFTAYDWRTDGTFDAGNGNAPISWPSALWNDTNSDVGYMNDLQVVRPFAVNCDQGIFLQNQVRARLVDSSANDISFIQTSPPHAIYWTTSNGLDYPNVDCVIENARCYNNFWSSAFKFEFLQRSLVTGLLADTGFGGVASLDCDDTIFSDINVLNISTPFAIITGSWSAGTTTVTVSDSSQIVAGYFLSSDQSSYGLPIPAEVAAVVDATTVTLVNPTTAASPGTVNIYIGTNSAGSTIISDKGSQRARFTNFKGSAVDGQDYVYGFDQREGGNRVLTNTALTSGTSAAGTNTLTFATASFPSQVTSTWLVRMVGYFLTAGTTITNRADVAGTTTLTLSANLLAAVPIGLKVGFYQEITIATTLDAASGTSVLTFASTTGIATNWYVSGDAGLRNLSKVSSLTATTVTLNRTLRATIPSGTSLTFRSDKWGDFYLPDQCIVRDATISVKRSSSSITVTVYKTEGSFVTFDNCKTIAYPVTGTVTKYAMYMGGSQWGSYNNRIIDPTLLGLIRIIDVGAFNSGLVVDARNAMLMSGTDASTVHDAAGILGASKFILDGVRSGTATLTLVGGTIAGANTYSQQTCNWRRWNDVVYVDFRVQPTLLLSTGTLTINGLPFTSAATIAASAMLPVFGTGVTVASGEVLVGKVLVGSTAVTLSRRNVTNSDPALNAGAVSGSALITASITTGVMTVTAVTNGTLAVGQIMTSGASTVGTIASFGTGAGGTGTYNLTGGVDTGSGTLSASGGTTTGRFEMSFSYITSDAF